MKRYVLLLLSILAFNASTSMLATRCSILARILCCCFKQEVQEERETYRFEDEEIVERRTTATIEVIARDLETLAKRTGKADPGSLEAYNIVHDLKIVLSRGREHLSHLEYEINILLSVAVVKGHTDIIDILLKAGVDINGENPAGETPLTCAICYGRVDMVRELIRRGALVGPTKTGKIPVELAVGRSDVFFVGKQASAQMVHLLLEAGATMGKKSLISAAQEGNKEVVKELLGRKADIDYVSSPDGSLGIEGGTALMYAVREGDMGMVRLLIEEGNANILVCNEHGKIAKDIARDMGLQGVTTFLGGLEKR